MVVGKRESDGRRKEETEDEEEGEGEEGRRGGRTTGSSSVVMHLEAVAGEEKGEGSCSWW